ncbi:MAG TPA: HNH endonuclease family protein, partial [Puia sp.]|nr:HNH endonuclease family protein [Puia sp.]
AVQKKLNEIRDKILKLKVIYIELDNEDDAYIIFETLNTRGKDLSVGDLVKNYLTKHIKAKNVNVDLPKDKWGQIRDNIDSTTVELDLDTFLLHVWLSKYEFTTTKTLFKKLKNTIKSGQAKTFLDELLDDSEIYKTIFDTQIRKWNKNELPIKNSLEALYSFKVTQQTPMVLSIMREYNLGKLKFRYAIEALEAIEHFHFIFTAITSQRSSGGIASMYSTYARQLSLAKEDASRLSIIRELKSKMKEKIPTYDEFLASFRTLRFTNDYTKQKRIIQYTLGKIDKYYNQSGVVINYEMMTLEHILSQNPKSKGANHEEYVGLIGNLIFIDEKTNNSLSNKTFVDKIKILKDSGIYLDDVLKNSKTWSEKEIEKRTEKLAAQAFRKVFKI